MHEEGRGENNAKQQRRSNARMPLEQHQYAARYHHENSEKRRSAWQRHFLSLQDQ